MLIASEIMLDVTNRPIDKINKLKKLLTYSNPKYEEARRMGFYTGNIPKTIQTYAWYETTILHHLEVRMQIARGEIAKIRNIFPDEKIEDAKAITNLSVEYENTSFELDIHQSRVLEAIGKKRQGLIHAATSAGKSAIILRTIADAKCRALVIVHRKILLEQLLADARRWLKHCTIGQIGGGKCELGKDVTIAIDKSLGKLLESHPERAGDWGLVIQDEVHLCAAPTFQGLISRLPAAYRYGFTGTLKRKDRMEFLIYATYGSVIATITKDELLEAGRVSPVEVKVVETEAEVDPAFFDLPVTKKFQAIDKSLHENDLRNLLIVQEAAGILRDPNKKLVILSRYVAPCYQIGALSNPEWGVRYVTGREDDPSASCDAMRTGNCRVIYATIGCFSTGVSISDLTDIILISPIFNNELLIHQIRGRLMRKAEGKTHGTLHFIWDPLVFPARSLNRFLAIMKK